MSWQDILISIGTLIFLISLLPTLFNRNAKVPLLTSVPTFIILFLFAYTFFTLELYFTMIADILTGTVWLLIAILRKV